MAEDSLPTVRHEKGTEKRDITERERMGESEMKNLIVSHYLMSLFSLKKCLMENCCRRQIYLTHGGLKLSVMCHPGAGLRFVCVF